MRIKSDGYPYRWPQPAGAITYQLNGAQVGRGNTLNLEGAGITAIPGPDKLTYVISGGGAGGVVFGDPATGYTPTMVIYVDNAGNLTGDGGFVRDPATLATTIDIGATYLNVGDTNVVGNGTMLNLNDASQILRVESGTMTFLFGDVLNGYYFFGSDGSVGNGTGIEINDATGIITAKTAGDFEVTNLAGNVIFTALTTPNAFVKLGDADNVANSTAITIDDANKQITGSSENYVFYNGLGLGVANFSDIGGTGNAIVVRLGDIGIAGNGTRLELDDAQLRTDLYTQDFYLRGYNANIGIFAEITNTYADVMIGDASTAYGGTRLNVRSSDNQIVGFTDGVFRIRNAGNTGDYLLVDPANDDYALGDLGGLGNHNLIFIEDDNDIISVRTPGTFQVTDPSNAQWFTVNPTLNTVHAGNVSGAGNDTIFSVYDSSRLIQAQTDNIFKVINVAGSRFVDADIFNQRVRFGDIDNTTTNCNLNVDYGSDVITAATGALFRVTNPATTPFFSVDTAAGRVFASNATLGLFGYTVATLPVTAQVGDQAYVTDALGSSWGVAIAGGGVQVVPVFFNGSIWIAG